MVKGMMITVLGVLLFQAALVSCGNEWDYFVFSQTWPPGTCADAAREHHTCHVPTDVKTWTIHGLWPSVSTGSEGPFFCNNSLPFDFSKVAKLTPELDTYWPNMYNDTKHDSFWEHEWDKHGTCCQDLPNTAGEQNYFSKGLQLNQQYNITKMLAAGGIVPSTTKQYAYEDFIDAIKKSTGYEPVIECAATRLPSGEEFHLIDQIEICLTKDFKPQSCDNDVIVTKGDHLGSTHYKSKEDNTLYFEASHGRHRHRRLRDPQSNCPRKYNFNYPPIQYC